MVPACLIVGPSRLRTLEDENVRPVEELESEKQGVGNVCKNWAVGVFFLSAPISCQPVCRSCCHTPATRRTQAGDMLKFGGSVELSTRPATFVNFFIRRVDARRELVDRGVLAHGFGVHAHGFGVVGGTRTREP